MNGSAYRKIFSDGRAVSIPHPNSGKDLEAAFSEENVLAIESDGESIFDNALIVPHRRIFFRDGSDAFAILPPTHSAELGDAVLAPSVDGDAYAEVESISTRGVEASIVTESGVRLPLHVSGFLQALPTGIVASIQKRSGDWSGVDVTNEVLALPFEQFRQLSDADRRSSCHSIEALAELLGADPSALRIEVASAVSVFFGRLPSAGSAGELCVAREITAERFAERLSLHTRLTPINAPRFG